MNRRAALIPFLALLTVACGQTTAKSTSSPSPAVSDKYQLVLAESFNGGQSHLTVRDAATGKLLRRLPNGTPAPDWSRLYSTEWLVNSAARLLVTDPQNGQAVATTTIARGFDLPMLSEAVASGISPNGKWLTLARQTNAGANFHSEFSIGPSDLSQPFTNIGLDGNFEFDAISNDGKSLYLIQRLDDQGKYQVRLYNVGVGLSTALIIDKREPNEPMYGIRGDSVATADGSYQLTVYARDGGPFIHALPLGLGFAWCVDLPDGAPGDMESQFHWSLALSHDGSTLYAVNGATGSIAQLSVTNQSSPPSVIRKAQFSVNKPTALGLITEAEAKGAPIGGVALSADGRTLFAVAGTGIVAIDTATLKVRARYLQDHAIPSIRLSSDGKWLYATAPEAGTVWQLDPATGSVVHQVKGLDNPWAVLWVSAGA
jgi:DNA-binding beta-propeller fold protein YncE